MHNDPPTLSPAAQLQLVRLESATINGGNWVSDYMAMLKKLAERDTDDIAEWEIKGQGIEVLEKSREQHRVAKELKAYAIAQIPADISASVAKLPEFASLDNFLSKLMKDMGREPAKKMFVAFLTHEAEGRVDEQMELHPRPVTRDEYVAAMVRDRLANLEHDAIPQVSQHDLQQDFRAWRKTQGDSGLEKHNMTVLEEMKARHAALIALLPSRPDVPGLTKEKWKTKAKADGCCGPDRTFNRDVKTLSDKGMIHVQHDGNYRQIAK